MCVCVWSGNKEIVSCIESYYMVTSKVYFPEQERIRVHQMRTVQCPRKLRNGFYWYGHNQASPQKYPRRVEELSSVLPGDARKEQTPISPGGGPRSARCS